MAKMQDLKMSKKDSEESCNPCVIGKDSGPKYPYGTRISLENDALKKLGITKLPKVGSKIYIEAVGVVESVSQNSSQNGKDHRRVEIQLQKIGLDDGPSSMEDAVDAGIDDAE